MSWWNGMEGLPEEQLFPYFSTMSLERQKEMVREIQWRKEQNFPVRSTAKLPLRAG